jgi:hypothetical protein
LPEIRVPDGKTTNTIACICLTPALAETQRMLLEQRGYRVFVATNFHEIDAIARGKPFDCALISADIEPNMKRAIALKLEEKYPSAAILEICRISPEIDGAVYVLAEAPQDVPDAVDDLLNPHGRRRTEFLQRRSVLARQRAQKMIEKARKARERNRQARTNGSSRKKQGNSGDEMS